MLLPGEFLLAERTLVHFLQLNSSEGPKVKLQGKSLVPSRYWGHL